ncbi:hypothetical protein B0T25DRAFT_152356 [Lasiosphaeria hispida]|uniref:DUF3074 domain-containing protein n=1 Tax=Lasiosphaeria hispida TaxID=260671 RepID=A0AAJ0HLY5_9PEZI|nr:hypothetical protein B0T25DRAFT_152356 [Lasiosphaeria hispida]
MAHHEPFKSLGPLTWDAITSPTTTLPDLLTTTFANAQILVDSIPADNPPLAATKPQTVGRARSQTASAVLPSAAAAPDRARSATNPAAATQLHKEWKDVKASANPLGISVYKLAGKDGKGSWFARRSVHRGVGFEKWRLGLKREFAEALAGTVEDIPESEKGLTEKKGSVRGIGAERRVERVVVPGVGVIEVFLVSVRFPGPTTPRDFATMLFMPDDSDEQDKHLVTGRPLRQFMLVSRPVEHPDCPSRSGFIRGKYESVEFIREIPVEKPLRRVRSSVDLSRDEAKDLLGSGILDREGLSKEAALRSAIQRSPGEGGSKTSASSPSRAEDHGDDHEMAIEWLMVTRSDPGGSVPRFMVDKGTPGGIINDAGRFMKWLISKDIEDLAAAVDASAGEVDEDGELASPEMRRLSMDLTHRPSEAIKAANAHGTLHVPGVADTQHQEVPPPSGFYGMIASALEAAGSVVISRMSSLAGSAAPTDSEAPDDLTDDDTSSELSYASAEEGDEHLTVSETIPDTSNNPSPLDKSKNQSQPSLALSIRSTFSDASPAPSLSAATTAENDKALRKLEDRRRRAQEKIQKTQDRMAAKADNDKESHDAQETALAKLREKHERELAKQEEKYQRDLKKLQEKRLQEQKRAEERRRKATEHEEKRNLQMELEKARAERDLALRQIEMLKGQVGELQAQNTMLVAKLGRGKGKGGSVSGIDAVGL